MSSANSTADVNQRATAMVKSVDVPPADIRCRIHRGVPVQPVRLDGVLYDAPALFAFIIAYRRVPHCLTEVLPPSAAAAQGGYSRDVVIREITAQLGDRFTIADNVAKRSDDWVRKTPGYAPPPLCRELSRMATDASSSSSVSFADASAAHTAMGLVPRLAAVQVPDHSIVCCSACDFAAWSAFNHKHHCHICGLGFCHACTAMRVTLPPAGIDIVDVRGGSAAPPASPSSLAVVTSTSSGGPAATATPDASADSSATTSTQAIAATSLKRHRVCLSCALTYKHVFASQMATTDFWGPSLINEMGMAAAKIPVANTLSTAWGYGFGALSSLARATMTAVPIVTNYVATAVTSAASSVTEHRSESHGEEEDGGGGGGEDPDGYDQREEPSTDRRVPPSGPPGPRYVTRSYISRPAEQRAGGHDAGSN